MFSEAADRNKEAILQVAESIFSKAKRVLEIGSGTGQHAVFFAKKFPHLTWIASDLGESLSVLKQNMALQPVVNILKPVEIDVRQQDWQVESVDVIYSANCLHIMGWESVKYFFRGVGDYLNTDGYLVVYGPFKYEGLFTTPSNADFDLWLKERDPASGIRDFEQVDALAKSIGLELLADHAMPANNQCLIWKKAAIKITNEG